VIHQNDGSSTTPVLGQAGGNVQQIDWSPVEDILTFRLVGTNDLDLYTYSMADSALSKLVTDRGDQNFPRFSRDGRYVAYESLEFGGSQIMVVASDGSSKLNVTTEGGSEPVWSADDKLVYFRRGVALYAIPVEFDFRFDVFWDGSGFLISDRSSGQSSLLNLTYNLGEYLKEAAPAVE
jgi:Tol biopolymer transport system component